MTECTYPAVFIKDGTGFSVLFPDIPCYAHGANYTEAVNMAVDALYLTLNDWLKRGKELPKTTSVSEVATENPNAYAVLGMRWNSDLNYYATD